MKNVDISIVVPIYNAELYLEETLESIYLQTFKNYELLLINDGSTDNSGEICKKYLQKDPRVHYFYRKNSGVSDTRNFGIENANGKYICFIDSDDKLDKNYLSDFIDIYSKNDIELGCCMFRKFKNIDDIVEHNRTLDSNYQYENDEKYDIIFSNYSGYLWNKMFVTSIIKDNNIFFDKSIGMMEDMLFIFKYLEYVRKAVCIENENYLYRLTNNSASKNLANVKWFSLFKSLDYMLDRNKLYPNKIYNMLCFNYLFYLCNAKFRLRFIKNHKDYKAIVMYLNEKNNKTKELYKYLNLKQKVKIFIYKNFNFISFKLKILKDS